MILKMQWKIKILCFTKLTCKKKKKKKHIRKGSFWSGFLIGQMVKMGKNRKKTCKKRELGQIRHIKGSMLRWPFFKKHINLTDLTQSDSSQQGFAFPLKKPPAKIVRFIDEELVVNKLLSWFWVVLQHCRSSKRFTCWTWAICRGAVRVCCLQLIIQHLCGCFCLCSSPHSTSGLVLLNNSY